MGLRDRLRQRLLDVMLKREPDFIIGGTERPYLLRWYLTPWSGKYRDVPEAERTLWQRFVRALPNAYLHLFLRSDDDRALHDHPWLFNASVLLEGNYIEHVPDPVAAEYGFDPTQHPVKITRRAGSWYFRWGKAIHRVELIDGLPCTTLFITGPAAIWRDWGFYCPKGFVPWRKFTATEGGVSKIGRGCE